MHMFVISLSWMHTTYTLSKGGPSFQEAIISSITEAKVLANWNFVICILAIFVACCVLRRPVSQSIPVFAFA